MCKSAKSRFPGVTPMSIKLISPCSVVTIIDFIKIFTEMLCYLRKKIPKAYFVAVSFFLYIPISAQPSYPSPGFPRGVWNSSGGSWTAEMPLNCKSRSWKELKQAGNECFKMGQYGEAGAIYSQAIQELQKSSKFLWNTTPFITLIQEEAAGWYPQI